jgi:hypothetical protein
VASLPKSEKNLLKWLGKFWLASFQEQLFTTGDEAFLAAPQTGFSFFFRSEP